MTQKNFKVKKGDLVQIISGRYKGSKGSVEKVFLKESRVLVEGVNQVVRFAKASQTNPDGPYRKTLPIHISNVALVDPTTGLPGKIGYRLDHGEKIRFFKRTGAVLESRGTNNHG